MLIITAFVLQYLPILSLPILEVVDDVQVTYRPVPNDLKDIFNNSDTDDNALCMKDYTRCIANSPKFHVLICAGYNQERKLFLDLCEMMLENCKLRIVKSPTTWEYIKDVECESK